MKEPKTLPQAIKEAEKAEEITRSRIDQERALPADPTEPQTMALLTQHLCDLMEEWKQEFQQQTNTLREGLVHLKGQVVANVRDERIPPVHPSYKPRNPITCYACGKLGHIARECRSKPQGRYQQPNSPYQPPSTTLSHLNPININGTRTINRNPKITSNSRTQTNVTFDMNVFSLDHLDEQQTNQLSHLLRSYKEIFASEPKDLPGCPIIQHKIRTTTDLPIYKKSYRLPETKMREAQNQIDEMLEAGIIRRSVSAYNAPLVLVPKKDGKTLNFYRRFIPNCSDLSTPLNALTKKNKAFIWTTRTQDAFDSLKKALMEPPVLMFPDFNQPFFLATDSSGYAGGAVLQQKDEDNQLHPIAYYSYSIIKNFRPYLLGRKFTIITDHRALRWLMSSTHVNNRLARWALTLSDYDLDIDETTYKNYQLSQGNILVKIDPEGNRGVRNPRIVIPEPLIGMILKLYHDAPFSGHLGVKLTTSKIRRKYFWAGIEQSEQDNPTLIPIHPDLVEGGETNTQSESSESEDDDPSEPTSPSTQPSTSRPTSARNPNPTHPYQTRSSGPVKSAPWIFEEKRDTQTESVEPQAQRQEDLSSDGTLDTEDNEDPQTEDQLSDTVNEPNWAGRTLSGMFDLLKAMQTTFVIDIDGHSFPGHGIKEWSPQTPLFGSYNKEWCTMPTRNQTHLNYFYFYEVALTSVKTGVTIALHPHDLPTPNPQQVYGIRRANEQMGLGKEFGYPLLWDKLRTLRTQNHPRQITTEGLLDLVWKYVQEGCNFIYKGGTLERALIASLMTSGGPTPNEYFRIKTAEAIVGQRALDGATHYGLQKILQFDIDTTIHTQCALHSEDDDEARKNQTRSTNGMRRKLMAESDQTQDDSESPMENEDLVTRTVNPDDNTFLTFREKNVKIWQITHSRHHNNHNRTSHYIRTRHSKNHIRNRGAIGGLCGAGIAKSYKPVHVVIQNDLTPRQRQELASKCMDLLSGIDYYNVAQLVAILATQTDNCLLCPWLSISSLYFVNMEFYKMAIEIEIEILEDVLKVVAEVCEGKSLKLVGYGILKDASSIVAGALIGSLGGVIGGPIGAVVGSAVGGLIGRVIGVAMVQNRQVCR
ncbi:Retrovirus-related Pol polyprotein [Nymphon striatum]|nr:Retrovirus-related Pol polyprotein [Nymphon striatum]